jgi:nucleoside-diphosphate-sugar epimerase
MKIIVQKEIARQRIFNVGNPANETTIKDLALRMINFFTELNPRSSLYEFQTKTVASVDFYGRGYEDSDRRIPAIDSLQRLFGWQPQLGLDETLQRAMAGFISTYRSYLA